MSSIAGPEDAPAHSAIDESETTPLLTTNDDTTTKPRHRSRTLSLVTIITLICVCCIALVAGFVLPHATQKYVQDALVLDLQRVEILNITPQGLNINAQGEIHLDDARAHVSTTKSRMINFVLSALGPVKLKDNQMTIYLDDNGLHKIAKTELDNLTLRLSNGQTNTFDMVGMVNLEDTATLGQCAARVLEGTVDRVPITARIETTLQRFVTLRKVVEQQFNYKLPGSMLGPPAFNLTDLSVQDAPGAGLVGSARVNVDLRSPIDAAVPSVVLQVSIQGCDGALLPMVTAQNLPFRLDSSSSNIEIVGTGQCRVIPPEAFEKCDTHGGAQSPIDRVVQSYLSGNKTTVFVGGVKSADTSSWIQDILRQVSIPVDLPGGQVDQLARDIELSDVKLNLPSFFGGGGKPKISGKIQGIIDIPREVEVALEVDSVHVLADLLYKRRRFATIETPGWAPAISKFPTKEELLVQVILRDAPVTITNQDVFSDVVSALLGGSILVDVIGNGDVKVNTSLGALEAHSLPIEAKDVSIGGFGFLNQVKPKIKDLGVLRTTSQSLELVAVAEVDNPTDYEAHLNYADVLLMSSGRVLGNLTVENIKILPGSNDIRARLTYAPTLFPHASENSIEGSRLLSQYLSEKAANISLSAHNKSLPQYPELSEALAHLPLTFSVPIPRLVPAKPDDGDGDGNGDGGGSGEVPGTGSQFLVSARFHLFSSSATFVLRNPLNESITITDLNAVAVYRDDVIGTLAYGYPIVLSGTESETETTRIPVSWRLPASDILKRAVSGTLKVNATANATVSVGKMKGFPVNLEIREVGAGVGI